jgi:hypothetical protein
MKTHLLTAAVTLAVGAAGSWWFAPRRVETRVEYKDRWHTVTVKATKKTRTKTTKKADGTVITDTSTTQTASNTKAAGTTATKTLTTPAPRWNVSLLGGVDLKLQPVGGAHVTYRVVGPFTAGVWGIGGPATVAGGVSLGVTF